MKSNLKLIRKHRNFSDDFKRDIVNSFESGKFSVPQLERLHNVSHNSIYRWIYKFSTFNEKGSRIIEMKSSNTVKLKELEQKIKDLERIVGQKQIQVEYLEKMIDIARDELNIDIKKNYNTLPSNGSGNTKNK